MFCTEMKNKHWKCYRINIYHFYATGKKQDKHIYVDETASKCCSHAWEQLIM